MAQAILSATRSAGTETVGDTGLAAAAGRWLVKIRAAVAAHQARRRLASYGEAMLSDIGVAPCAIDWAVRNGRDL